MTCTEFITWDSRRCGWHGRLQRKWSWSLCCCTWRSTPEGTSRKQLIKGSITLNITTIIFTSADLCSFKQAAQFPFCLFVSHCFSWELKQLIQNHRRTKLEPLIGCKLCLEVFWVCIYTMWTHKNNTADSTAFHLLSEDLCHFKQSLCWRTDQLPTATRDLMTAGIIGFAWAVTSEEGYMPHNIGCIDFPELISAFRFDYEHTPERNAGSALSPGLDGQKRCWYRLWNWRPRPSRSCQTSWK